MRKKLTRQEARAKVRTWIADQESREHAAVGLKCSTTTLDNLVKDDYRMGLELAVMIEDLMQIPPRVWVRG